MLSDNAGTPVHFPADPTTFRFDDEVAKIFPNMAERSIPHFQVAHKAHAMIVAADPVISRAGSCTVLDVGSSRGHFLQHMLAQGVQCEAGYVAVDNSQAMCDALRTEFPWLDIRNEDITSESFASWLHDKKFDVVCCNYVLQFLPVQSQVAALVRLMSAVKPGGYFFLGHKSRHQGLLGDSAHELYIQWRILNGYTREEVEAKTQALKGSMFPMSHEGVLGLLRANFSEVQETFRFMMFSNVAARK